MFDEAKIRFNMPVRYDQEYKLWGKLYPREFFDRQQERSEIRPILEDLSNRQPIAIIGERRSGKTSMLLHIELWAQKKGFLVLKIQEYGVTTARELYHRLWTELEPDLSKAPPEHVDEGWMQGSLLHMMEQRSMGKSEGKLEDKPVPILLWIDELDTLFENEKMSDDEKTKILGFLLQLIERTDFPAKLIFSITHEFPELEHIRSSPLIYKARRVKLRPFPKKDAEAMIPALLEDRKKWNEVAPYWDWDRFCAETGCQPYYMKLLLVHLGRVWQRHEGRIEKEAWWEEAIQHALQDDTFTNSCEHIYKRHFDERERAVLLWMVRSEEGLSPSALEEAELENVARNLVERFYLQEEKGRVTFRLGLLRRWLAEWPDFKKEWRKYKQLTLPSVISEK